MGNIHCCSCIIFLFSFLLKLHPIYNLEASNSWNYGAFFLLLHLTFLEIYLFIVLQYVASSATCSFRTLGNSDENSTSKRRKTCAEDIVEDCIIDEESKDSSKNYESTTCTSNFMANLTWILLGFLSVRPFTKYSLIAYVPITMAGDLSDGTSLSTANVDVGEKSPALSLVKLTRSGLLLFTLPRSSCHDTVGIVANIVQSLETRSTSSPQWVVYFMLSACFECNKRHFSQFIKNCAFCIFGFLVAPFLSKLLPRYSNLS